MIDVAAIDFRVPARGPSVPMTSLGEGEARLVSLR
jgi:hypothetical protein